MRTRAVLPAAALLTILVACSSTTTEPTAGSPSSAESASSEAIAVTVADFMIEPSSFETSGPTVTIEATNDGPTPHNFTVRDGAGEIVMATQDLSSGESETISAELDPGEYTIFCSLAGHESLGMSGTLTVGGS
jgi:plastocyanin